MEADGTARSQSRGPSSVTRPATPPPSTRATQAPAEVTVVTTAEELVNATLAGAQDIEIQAHLDLRNTRRQNNTNDPTEPVPNEHGVGQGSTALLASRGNMRSMRVRSPEGAQADVYSDKVQCEPCEV